MSRATKQPTRTVFDSPAVKRVTAWALLWRQKPTGGSLDELRQTQWLSAGRIIVAFPDDGAGVVRAYVEIHSGPLAFSRETPLLHSDGTLTVHSTHGTAGGYNYDKASAAVADACDRLAAGPAYEALSPLHGTGMSSVRTALEANGYQVIEVL